MAAQRLRRAEDLTVHHHDQDASERLPGKRRCQVYPLHPRPATLPLLPQAVCIGHAIAVPGRRWIMSRASPFSTNAAADHRVLSCTGLMLHLRPDLRPVFQAVARSPCADRCVGAALFEPLMKRGWLPVNAQLHCFHLGRCVLESIKDSPQPWLLPKVSCRMHGLQPFRWQKRCSFHLT